VNQIYVQSGENQQGPLTESQVKALLDSGAISMDCHYWHEGMDAWAPITELTDTAITEPEPSIGELKVADCLIKWNCPYCKEKVSLDFKLLEQIKADYEGKIACPICNEQLEVPEIHANPVPVVSESKHPHAEISGDSDQKANSTGKYTLSPGIQTYLAKQANTLKIITYIDLFLLIPTLIGVAFLLLSDGDWDADPLTICAPFALPRVWGVIVMLRILKTLRKLGIKELGPLDIYNHIMDFCADKWWIPAMVDDILPLPLYLLIICPVIGTAVLYLVYRKISSVILKV
jgi:hypothetical protein